MNLLLDSVSVLTAQWRLVAGILLIMLPCQLLAWSGLKMIFGDRLTSGEYYSLTIAGWTVPALFIAAVWLVWKILQGLGAGALILWIVFSILAILLFLRAKKEPLKGSKPILLILLALSGLLVFLRLAFISRVPIPLYFDSAQHYLIIKNFAGNSISSPTPVYYHLGYHLLAALIVSMLHAEIINMMLVLGQMIVGVIPLSLFFLIRHETRSDLAGIFAVLLAAFGWYMPAHAVEWGKYPALTSLLSISFLLGLAYLSVHDRRALSPGRYLALNAVLLLASIVSVLIHSRTLILLGILVLAWLITSIWQRHPKPAQWIVLGAVILGIAIEIFSIQTKAVLGPLFDPYGNKGILVTVIVALLTLFALWAFPRLAFAAILAIFFLLGSLFVPVRGIPGYIDLTLLDRPFVEMILFLPLSLLGGLGLAGLEQLDRARLAGTVLVQGNYIRLLFIVILLVNALFKYEVYPSGCCSLVGRDDLVAIDWIDKNLPVQARVLTSSTQMMVMDTDAFQGAVGGDAGIWISPLTNRGTLQLPYSSDFAQQTTLDWLCKMGVTHIYVGETGLTFDDATLAPHPEWYQILLFMPRVKVYRVIGCP